MCVCTRVFVCVCARARLCVWGCTLTRTHAYTHTHTHTHTHTGFQLVHTPHPVSGKAAADIAMVVDVMSTLHSMPLLSCFVLATGDSDFSHVFSHLKKEGRTVVGVGPRSVLSRIVTNTVDKFVFTDEGTGAHHQRMGKLRRKRASVKDRALKVKSCGVKKAKSAQQTAPRGSQEAKKIVKKRTQGARPRRRREQLKEWVLKAKTKGVKKAKSKTAKRAQLGNGNCSSSVKDERRGKQKHLDGKRPQQPAEFSSKDAARMLLQNQSKSAYTVLGGNKTKNPRP